MTITYTAFDGKQFTDKEECEKYENMLTLLGSTYNEIHKFISKIKDYENNLWICKEKLETEPHCGQDLPTCGDVITIIEKDDLSKLRCLDGLLEKYKLNN